MARHNIVHIYGFVHVQPNIIKNEAGKIESVITHVILVSSSRPIIDNNAEEFATFDQAMVLTRDPEMAKKMATLNVNDVIVLKGTLNTRNVPKIITCENCHKQFLVSKNGEKDLALARVSAETEQDLYTSMKTFITPIALDIRKTGLTQEEAMNFIINMREMSNEVQLVGRLCIDPVQWEGGKATTYQLAVVRQFYVKDDNPQTRTDYPYIRVYGEQAESDYRALSKSSMVLVDGTLKTRRFRRTNTCPECKCVKEWYDKVLEVVPYSVQYLKDYKTAEMINAENEAAIAASGLFASEVSGGEN